MYQEKWKPDPTSSVPLFQQIFQFIKEKIRHGDWTVGTKLPAQRELAREFGVNRSTVVAALEELKAEGLIEGKYGAGTRVSSQTWQTLSPPPPDWNTYVQQGVHHPNLRTIQEINKAEFYPNTVRLGTGELAPELLPIQQIRELFKHAPQKLDLGYEDPRGNRQLREEIQAHVRQRGILTSTSSILIVSGALQALQLIALGLLARDSTILLERASYLQSVHVFRSAGMKLCGIPLDEQGIMPSALNKLKQLHQAAMLYVNPSFHNPTGIVSGEKRRSEILEVCQQMMLPIVEDDTYADLWLAEPSPAALKAIDTQGLVLYLGSMSKALSAGLRIGWVIGPEPVIERLADIKMQMDYGSSSLSQWVVTQFLSSSLYKQQLTYVREQLRMRREKALEALEHYFEKIATWNIPQGGFYIWLQIKGSVPMRQVFEKALKEGVLINPGYLYDRYDNTHIRLSYAYAAPLELENGLAILAKVIKEFSK
ncbi:PLP-dependent aminotransferase family protein [Bacillus horti]|uniref:GntR family transcriptional regulator of abcA and norABC n=1 Tax=Caldalkalibacillus horti TaxID=77523 RepID=A0ABT9W000_9BACI|nr:PLP-dependent aminotransferase family protein [Bacillus horti]MDQ0166581.1 GntR family transcriptional regulator of abcA and norABC [Bacillus horti]